MIRRVGERAFLVDLGGTAAVLALRSALLATPLAGQVDVVAGARTVLVRLDRSWSERWVQAQLDRLEPAAAACVDGPPVEIEVVYDGDDLAEVGAVTGLGGDGIVAAHTAVSWRVAFSGFAPGFGYLVPDGELPWPPVARRAGSRPRVPAGSVGLAGEFSGVYPRASPGGWQLIGRTAASLWRSDRDPPALLTPGIGVRFRAVTSLPEPAVDPPRSDPAPSAGLLVRRPGLLCLIEDRGRPGRSELGVSTSGAADRAAAVRANVLVGNPPDAAVLEFLLGGFELEALGAQLVAVTGAP